MMNITQYFCIHFTFHQLKILYNRYVFKKLFKKIIGNFLDTDRQYGPLYTII